MDFLRGDNWVWDVEKGAKGVAFLGTDFNVNRDVKWFEDAFPRTLWHLFESIEVLLLPSHNASALASLDEHGLPILLINVQWLKDAVAARDWTGIEETLVHERQHLIQLLEGRLVLDHKRRMIVWEGKDYLSMDQVGFGKGQRYLDLPWEQEAFWVQAEYLHLKGLFDSQQEAFQVLQNVAYRQAFANAA